MEQITNIRGLSFGPNDRYLAVEPVGYNAKNIAIWKIWDAETGKTSLMPIDQIAKGRKLPKPKKSFPPDHSRIRSARACVICGAIFRAAPSSKKVTCSPGCSKKRKTETHTGVSNIWNDASKKALASKGQTPNLLKGTPAAQKSPIAGPFETNQNALIWTIKSPDNVELCVRNLRKFIRDNPELFDGTEAQAWAGFAQMRRSMQGKTKRRVGQWKGWRLVAVSVPDDK